jgi:pilus assembly protein CpaD
MNKTLQNLRLGLLAAALGLSLAACTPEELALDTKYTPSSGSEQYPITVGHGPQTLNIANKSGTLQPSQVNAITAFANRAAVAGTSPVHVARPAASSSRLSHEVANLLMQQGVAKNSIHMTTYRGAASGPVKITYRTAHTHVAKCGNWSEDVTNTKFNEPMPNLGCAVQSNIAAMVSDPNDLNGPKPSEPAMASSRIPALVALDGAAASSAPSSTGSSGGSSGGLGGGSKSP